MTLEQEDRDRLARMEGKLNQALEHAERSRKDHEKRLRRLENLGAKITGGFAAVAAAIQLAWNALAEMFRGK